MVFTANTDDLVPKSSCWMETFEGGELQQRLGLYQVFLKLYEQNRGLLDEILRLENSGSRTLAHVSLPFVQGVVSGQDVYLVTNLLQGTTQILTQPQQAWSIGRDPNQVVLPIQDNRLSRCHAALKYVEHQGFYLIDLGSRNGSHVNGEQVRYRLLRDGDRVRLGSMTFVFYLCQTVRHLRSLSSDMMAMLEDWQPHSSQAIDAKQPLDGATTEMSSDVQPLDETSRFMRLAQSIANSYIQE